MTLAGGAYFSDAISHERFIEPALVRVVHKPVKKSIEGVTADRPDIWPVLIISHCIEHESAVRRRTMCPPHL